MPRERETRTLVARYSRPVVFDLFFVFAVARLLSRRAQERGYPGYLAVLGPLGWVAGEVVGIMVATRLGAFRVLLASWAGAAAGVALAFAVVRSLPVRPPLGHGNLGEGSQ